MTVYEALASRRSVRDFLPTPVSGAVIRRVLEAAARSLYVHPNTVRYRLKKVSEVIGWNATGGVCDGNNIAACGVPVVDTMGPRGGAIHSSDEFLIVDSLAERAQLSALTMTRIAERGTV